jgi:hypothetical protein
MITQKTQYFLSLLLFQLFNSCKNPQAAEEMKNELIGTWKLTNSAYVADSSFINTTWIDFNKDSTFNCNNSVFWEFSTTRTQYLEGRYNVDDSFVPNFSESTPSRIWYYLYLKVGTKTKKWYLLMDNSMIYWRISDTTDVEYTWNKGN